MSDVLKEWIAKAEGDFRTASRELAAADRPNYDAVCFHAQQCAEKYLKALLIARGQTPPKIHDLAQLHRLLVPVCPEWQWSVDELRLLSRSAVISRYPGEVAELTEAEAAHGICGRLRERLRELLGVGD
jgi:HEPN domain-containing protein